MKKLFLILLIFCCSSCSIWKQKQIDDALKKSIEQELAKEKKVVFFLRELSIIVNNGRVGLHGNVDNESQKEIIIAIVKAVEGVEEIDDNITVGDQAGYMGLY
tara:strand:+ start:188 stop:496 length:309 start_codon:yes stop_codon:yes gene_type:complete